ncbi:MAG: hypothetical protein ACYC2Y_03210 [Armatimonadota bacterium]
MRILISACLAAWLAVSAGAATISSLSANGSTVPKYGRYELTFQVGGDYNPFRTSLTGSDISKPGIDVWAEVTTPSGIVRVPGFWDIDYEYLGRIGDYGEDWDRFDKYVPASGPHWHVRYSPQAPGAYKVRVYAKDAAGTVSSGELGFTCAESASKGFVKVSGERLTYSNGEPYVAMGTSIKDKVMFADDYIPAMKANGMNFGRRWVVNGDMGDIHREMFPQTWVLSGGAAYDTPVRRSGERSVKKSVSGTGFFMQEQFIGVRKSSYYRTGAWIRTSSDFNGQAAVRVIVYNTDGSRKTYNGSAVGAGRDWTQSSMVLPTAANADFVDVQVAVLSGSRGTVWVDDLSLYETDSGGRTKVDYNYLWQPDLERWNPSKLRLWPIWRCERLLDLGEANGVAIQTCIFDYRLWNTVEKIGFYTTYFGDFWTDPEAIAQEEDVLRYMVARFASHKSLFAWELTNEMDPSYTDIRDKWISGRANFIRKWDWAKHPVTNSYWTSPGDVRFVQLPAMDLNQVHFYINTEERDGGQGVPTWWTQPSGVTIERSGGRTGPSCMKFVANGSTRSEGQSVYLVPGRSYTFRYHVKTSGITGSAGAILRFYGTSGSEIASSKTLTDSGSMGYTERTHTFTAPSNLCRVHVTLQVQGASGTAWFDDVQMIDNSTGRDVFFNGGFESPNFGDDEYEWALYFTYWTRAMAESGPNPTRKPWVSGEFGLMGANADLSGWANPTSSFPRHDTSGIHIHNCVWAQLMASSALHTPSYWWINEYIVPNNLLPAWKGATTFAANLPFYERGSTVTTAPYPAEVRATSTSALVRVLGQKRGNSAYLWIQNSQNTWSRVIRQGLSPTPTSAVVRVPGFANGTYALKWYDTYTGATRTETVSVTDGNLSLSVSSLAKDVAVIVTSSATVEKPNVTLSLSVDKASAAPGETVTYTLSYTNSGSAGASNVTIRLPVPAQTEYVSGGQYDLSTGSVVWVVPSLAPGASGKCVVTLKVR